MVATVAELEACLGTAALPARLKAIDHLDAHAAQWIAAAPLMTLATAGGRGGVHATLAGGDPGFAGADGAHALTIDRAALDDGNAAPEPGRGVSCLFVVPGVTETFRVAGRIADVTPARITVEARECFVHCGKALIRSAFWEPAQTPSADLPAAARFCVLATADADGNVDTSPKGDPAGFMIQLDDRTIALPDRLGNKRADGHRNILANDRVALIAFVPGGDRAYALTGSARLTRDAELLERMKVEEKSPQLATLIAIDDVRTYESQALRRARVWDADRLHADRPSPAATLAAHIKLSQARLKAEMPLEITPDSVEKALAVGYKTTLY